MRVKQLLLVCTLALSVVAVGPASPASAIHCRTDYLANMPPPPPPEQLVIVGDSIRVDGNLALAYALAVADHFEAQTMAFVDCQIAEAEGVAGNVLASIACTQARPPIADSEQNKIPRYVTVSGLTVEVHHSVLLADAEAIIACWTP
ncbi:MAG TPA: hypothetical protein VEU29_02850 [Actinomycetota bacterium]|nr:hypothetical protein [Actinomycetota bacterium]